MTNEQLNSVQTILYTYNIPQYSTAKEDKIPEHAFKTFQVNLTKRQNTKFSISIDLRDRIEGRETTNLNRIIGVWWVDPE